MALDPWNPFQEMLPLREAIERFMQGSLFRPGSAPGFGGPGSLSLDLAESDQQFVVRAALPGMKPEDIHITLQGDTLTIRGEMQTEQEQRGQRWILREQRMGSFQRSLRLPTPVNADQAEAHYADGILTLTLPKAEASRTKQIKVASQTSALPQGQEPSMPQGRSEEQAPEQPRTDRVEEASIDSFPASDAPSWGPH
jgi:HSP20 family protein